MISEDDNLRRYALKAYHRYEKKYSGAELRNRVFRACANQGYPYELITAMLDEMEFIENEED